MDANTQKKLLAELKYEIDTLYVATEIVLSSDYKQPPLDSMIFEVALLHFRVVWDFFYAGGNTTDFTVRDLLSDDQVKSHRPKQPKRLKEIRDYLDDMLAHLTHRRIDGKLKALVPNVEDFKLIRTHTEELFNALVAALNDDQKAAFRDGSLSHKFTKFKTLQP
jgi:hypothetical protein